MSKKKKILIVDDHPLIRQGMASVIEEEPEIEVCGRAGSVGDALELIESSRPDLVVTDLTLPDRNGLELIKDLKALHPEIPVMVVSMHDEKIYAERVLRAGARGYLMKEAALDFIADAIRQVLSGGVYVSDAITRHFLEAMTHDGKARYSFPLQRLSDREIEVFELIGQGKNNHDIAEQLHISSRTVDTHRRHIREKLNLNDSSAVLSHAVKWVESGKVTRV